MDSSDEDIPLAAKQAVARRDDRPASSGAHKRGAPVKAEPVSPSSPKKPDKTGQATGSRPPLGAAQGAKATAVKSGVVVKQDGAGSSATPSKPPTQPAAAAKAKKEHALPGQSRDTPDENDPLRKFYTSLLAQRSNSEMARRWCAMHGLLPRAEAEAWVEEQARKRAAAKPATAGRSPSKSAAKPRVTTPSSGTRPDAKAPPRGAPAPKAAKAAPAKRKAKPEADGDGWDDDLSDDEVLPTKVRARVDRGGRAADSHAQLERKLLKTVTGRAPRTTKDVAFADGGLEGSDSDDDVPLMIRKKL